MVLPRPMATAGLRRGATNEVASGENLPSLTFATDSGCGRVGGRNERPRNGAVKPHQRRRARYLLPMAAAGSTVTKSGRNPVH